MSSAVLWQFKLFCLALWLYNILVVNVAANCCRLQESLGHWEHIHIWFPSTLLYCIADKKTEFPILWKNSVAVKGLT